MEVDEIDTGLLEQFGSLQTVDHADLVRQMRRLVGGEESISESSATFYLEMSNWNVHAAVGHYFDLSGGAAGPPLPSMTFVRDVTIGEGESVPPSTDFTKTWTVLNSGIEPWPPGCGLRFTQGNRLSDGRSALTDRLEVGCLPPGEKIDVSVSMRSPDEPGIYQSQWRMSAPNGAFFGDIIWVIIPVEPSGTLALTQQMDKFHAFGPPSAQSQNAFSSSTNSTSSSCSSTSLNRHTPMSNGPTSSGDHNTPGGTDHLMNPFASPTRVNSNPAGYLTSHSPSAATACPQQTPLSASPAGSFSSPHLLMRRPSSPTDRGQPVVSARNLLARKISETPLSSSNKCDDEEMD